MGTGYDRPSSPVLQFRPDIPTERDLAAITGGGMDFGGVTTSPTTAGSIRLIKRCTKKRTITLHGIDHREPLTPVQAVFLEEALKKAMNDANNNDGVSTRTTLLIEEELQDEYYTTMKAGSTINGGGARRYLRGLGSRVLQVISSSSSTIEDQNIFFDMHFMLDMICFVRDDDDDVDPRDVNTMFPIRDPTLDAATCQVCDPNDENNDDDDDGTLDVPGEMDGETESQPHFRPRSGKYYIAESNFCAAIRTGPFSRFESVSSCSIK